VWLKESETAIVEMSEAAGLWRIAPNERDAIHATTVGVGAMLRDSIQRGARSIIVGLGGSATNDGGVGMARGLGFRFVDAADCEIGTSVADLLRLHRIQQPDDLVLPEVQAAADVRNPLLGPNGASHVFGRQKGATADQVEIFENALTRLSDVAMRDLGRDCRDEAGAGAAGGLGFGLATFCRATLRSGFELVAEAIELEKSIARADVVITGEGRLDAQTIEGKAPAGVARLARAAGKPVYAIVGSVAVGAQYPFDGVVTLESSTITRTECMERTAELLRERARELAQRFTT
jgi:glycerate kinase